MIYKDRKYLAILELTENRNYVTYDELIQLLTERPSNTVYLERDGKLCGLITSGHIVREHDNYAHRIPFNQKFTYIDPGEYMSARQIFQERKNINVLPVMTKDHRLLGDYVRWNDLICVDYAALLLKDPYVLEGLRADAHNAILVEPSRGGEELFSWWRRRFEKEGIPIRVISRKEIKDYLDSVQYFLFVDEDEKIGVEVLNRWLLRYLYDGPTVNRQFLSIMDYLHRMRNYTSALLTKSVLKSLQDQGVFVLMFDFKENKHNFLAALDGKIRERNEKYGFEPVNRLPDELKESFAEELYDDAYKAQEFPLPMSFHMRFGIPYLSDKETPFLHIRDGERLTVNQPEKYDRCIYVYGPCVVAGPYVEDRYTISSLLQDKINSAGFSCKVVNRGFLGGYLNAERLQMESFQKGDIVIIDQAGSLIEDFPTLNLTDALEQSNAPASWFIDTPRHCNHKANQVYAHKIYQELVPVLQRTQLERSMVEQNWNYIDHFYLNHYFSDFAPANYRSVGAIVMNCNPFTLGHRYLIEEALKTVDCLIIFVVEEDDSFFSFQERFAMVCQGTNDLKVIVVPSGPYILSRETFPEYFQKIDDKDLKKNTEDDITLFADKIASKLGITYRFVGEELEDQVTNEYNEAMKRILPAYGIQVIEIPRKAYEKGVISASRVRWCLSVNGRNDLDELVPESTKGILFMRTS